VVPVFYQLIAANHEAEKAEEAPRLAVIPA
jgi:hypothetical protein